MVVVPADSYVGVEQLRTVIGVPAIRKAKEAELYLLFQNAELGTMPPLGALFGLPIYLDREVADQEFIAFNAGTHRDVIHMRVADFEVLVRPVIGDFCQPKCLSAGSFVVAPALA